MTNDMNTTMKSMVVGGLIALLLPIVAVWTSGSVRAQEFNTTSTMQGSGSTYSSQVTPVGATTVEQAYTTSSQRISGRRNDPEEGSSGEFGGGSGHGKEDDNQDEGSPIGSEWVLLAFAAGAAGGITLRRRK